MLLPTVTCQMHSSTRRILLADGQKTITERSLRNLLNQQQLPITAWHRKIFSDVLECFENGYIKEQLDLQIVFERADAKNVKRRLLEKRAQALEIYGAMLYLSERNLLDSQLSKSQIDQFVEATPICRTCPCEQHLFYTNLCMLRDNFELASFDGKNITSESLETFLRGNQLSALSTTIFKSTAGYRDLVQPRITGPSFCQENVLNVRFG